MATVAIMVGGAVLNAATFIGGNYLAKYLSGDSGQAALDEKKRHDLALEKYQRDYAQYQKDRTQLFDWVAQQDREKNKAFHDFQDTDAALALYNQTHQAKVAKPVEPQFSDYYKPSPQQKNGELLFIGASTLALGPLIYQYAVEMNMPSGRSTDWVKRLLEVVSALNNEVTRLIGKKPAVAIREKAVASKPATPYM